MKRLLPFLLIFLSSVALAESGAYRVEVIIFRNLDVIAETIPTEELRSFSQFPSLEEPKLPKAPPEGHAGELPDGAPSELIEVLRTNLPDDLHVIEQKGSSMDGVWRRLRSSQGYRPLLYASWDQNRTDYYPPMRVHDQQVIDTQLRPPTNIVIADLAADDPLAAYRSIFYQLDGSVQLKRSRFLHLFLDLEYREKRPVVPTETFIAGSNDALPEAQSDDGNKIQHGVFSLKQNRQVRTGRMQYFDTPYFGALILVSAIRPQ